MGSGMLEGTRFAWELPETFTKTMDRDFWVDYLSQNQEVLYRILNDLHHASAALKGDRSGRLPSVEDLRALVTNEYSNEPFGPALRKALGRRSVRWLAGRLNVNHSQLVRIMNGQKQIVLLNDPAESMKRIEAISKELRLHPSYFAEWRRLWLMSLIDGMFEVQPHLSIGIWKKFEGGQ